MPFKIQRNPAGLNAYFRISGGLTPIELEDRVRPHVDVTDMYGASQLVVANDVGGAGAITRILTGNATGQGRILQMSGIVVVGAAPGTQIRISIEFSPSQAFSRCIIASTVITAPVAGAQYVATAPFTRPIVFNPGASFTVNVQGDAAGVDHQIFGRHLFENFVVS